MHLSPDEEVGDDDDSHVSVILSGGEDIIQFRVDPAADGIHRTRSVDCDGGDSVLCRSRTYCIGLSPRRFIDIVGLIIYSSVEGQPAIAPRLQMVPERDLLAKSVICVRIATESPPSKSGRSRRAKIRLYAAQGPTPGQKIVVV